MNSLDAFIIIVFIFYVYSDSRRGFLCLTADLIGIVIVFIVASSSYMVVANFISVNFNLETPLAQSMSFLGIWLICQMAFYGLSRIILFHTSNKIKESKANRYLAILPAIAKGIILLVVVIILVMTLPFDPQIKTALSESFIAALTTKYAVGAESKMEQFTGSPTQAMAKLNTLLLATPDETTVLDFSTNSMAIDTVAEQTLLTKINAERQKAGEVPLTEDLLIRNVARAHSRDMLANGYFYHTSKTGLTLFDRFVRANVNFLAAAENIALAPTADLIHTGLMNSPKHKANILDPSFTKIGIGVMKSQYGLMVTEDFAN